MSKTPCPKCQSAAVERISRGTLIRTFSLFIPLKRYRCKRCNRAFVVRIPKAAGA